MKKFFIISVMLILPATVLAQGFWQVELGGAGGKIEATLQPGGNFTDAKGEQKDAGGLAFGVIGGYKFTDNFWLQGGLRSFGKYSLKPQRLESATHIYQLQKFEKTATHIGIGVGGGMSFTDVLSAAGFVEVGTATAAGVSLSYNISKDSALVGGFSSANFPEKTESLNIGKVKHKISATAVTFGFRSNF